MILSSAISLPEGLAPHQVYNLWGLLDEGTHSARDREKGHTPDRKEK